MATVALTAVSVDSYVDTNTSQEEATPNVVDDTDYYAEIEALDELEIHNELHELSTKKRIWKYWRYIVLYTYYVSSKGLSLIDLITDLILLFKAIKYNYIPLTIVLFLSVLSPYIISYSSGVKLFLFRKTFDSFRGFEKGLIILYILPTGILYFILLDIVDITFQLYRVFGYIILNKSHTNLKGSEEVLAEQIGMNRMNYEGFKRQKTVGQLSFETLPQCILQTLLFFSVIPGIDAYSSITQRDLLISIIAAVVNSTSQIIRLYWESHAVNESLLQYSLNCIVGRVSWVPFLHELNTQHVAEVEIVLDYNIKYNVPLATMWFGYKGSMEFDFSSVTIAHFVAALNMMSLQNDNDDEDDNMKVKNIKLSINFASSLRFLSIHDIVMLLVVCSQRSIILTSIDTLIDWKHAILLSIKHGKDISSTSNARIGNEPILNAIYKTQYDVHHKILISLLKYSDIDINLTNESGESIIHLLIKNRDYKGLLLIFKYCTKKNININMNYYDIRGHSPLYFALNQYEMEKKEKENKKIKFKKYLYEMLILYGNAHSNFPLNSDGLSPLAFALTGLKDIELALKLCNDYKSRLLSYEITILPSLFAQFVAKDDINNRYLDILLSICQQCYIDIDGIKDENGNNPLHFLIKHFGWTRKTNTKKSFLRLLQYLLPLKDNNWLRQKNNETKYPISLAFSSNTLQMDTIQCLIQYDPSIKQFCIEHHAQCIVDSLQDLVTFILQDVVKEAVFDNYSILMDNSDIKNKLIDSCLDLRLVKQLQYLCNHDGVDCSLSSTQQQRLQILKEEELDQMLLVPRQIREENMEKQKDEAENDDEEDSKYDNARIMLSVDDNDFDTVSAVSSNDMIKTVKTVKLKGKTDDGLEHKSQDLVRINWVELIYGLTVESLSSLDLITDILVLIELYKAEHVVWTTLMILATVCPYLVSYSVLITLFQKKSSNKNVSSFIRFLVGIFFMTPVCIVYFLLIDVTFMVYVIISTLFFIVSCGFVDVKDLIDDYIFKKIFGLSRMQIIGYRRLRTLSQLTFETIPQIFLQLRILQVSQSSVTGVDTTNLMISIVIAIFHLLFEAIIINLDSKACYLSFYHYSIICLGGRLNWIPYSHLFDAIHNVSKNDSNKAQDPNRRRKVKIDDTMLKMKRYNYECIGSSSCGIRYNVDFIFTNESIRNLTKELMDLPQLIPERWKLSKETITRADNLWSITLGHHCCKDIDLYAMTDLFRACKGRIKIDSSTVNWYELIFSNTDVRYLRYSPTNLATILIAFLEFGEFNVLTYLMDNRMGAVYNVNFVKTVLIRAGKLIALRNFYSGLVLFGLEQSSRNFIFYIMYYRLKNALNLNDKTYLKSVFMLLWYTSRGIFNDNTYIRSDIKSICNVLFQFQDIQENEEDNEFEINIEDDNIEAGADESFDIFNVQTNTVEINSINSNKDSMKRFFSKTIEKYFQHKKFQLIVNDGDIHSALHISFKLAEVFMCFHDQIEIFLLTLFDQVIEQTNGNNINLKTKFKKDNNIYVLIYNDYDQLEHKTGETEDEIKEAYKSMYGSIDDQFEKYNNRSAQMLTQKHIDLLEYIFSTPTKSINLTNDQYTMLQDMDGLLRHKWRIYHQYEKYIHLMKDWYMTIRPQKEEVDMIHIRPDENNVIFDIPLPGTIGLESVRVSFEECVSNINDEENKDNKDNKDRIMGTIYLDVSPLWTLKKQKGMIHPKHYDTLRWNKIILHKFTKKQLTRNKTYIIDVPSSRKYDIFNFNPCITEISLKIELITGMNQHITCNTISCAVSYYVTTYEEPYHDEKYVQKTLSPHQKLQRVATTLAPKMQIDDQKSNDTKARCCFCCVGSSEDNTDAQMERELQLRVRQSKKKKRIEQRILFLGLPNSGKQTLLKQLVFIHGAGFDDTDLISYKPMIFKSIRENIIALINGFKQLQQINELNDEQINAMNYIIQYNPKRDEKKNDNADIDDDMMQLDDAFANNVDILWSTAEIKLAFDDRRQHTFWIDDNMEHFFNDIKRIAKEDYIPTQQDIVLIRNENIDQEQREMEYEGNGVEFIVINAGNDRTKWIYFFGDNVKSTIFLASLVSYDESLKRDIKRNALKEALDLFEETVNRKELRKTECILFLNKYDLFLERIKSVPLSACFEDYNGRDDEEDGVSYIQDQFIEKNHMPQRVVFTHVTVATDQDNVQKVFWDVQNIMVRSNLKRGGLMI